MTGGETALPVMMGTGAPEHHPTQTPDPSTLGGLLPPATEHAYQAVEEESDGDTDSNTSEDSGLEQVMVTDLQSVPEAQRAEHVFWAYRSAKKVWRRFSNKSTRKVRRLNKRKRKRL